MTKRLRVRFRCLVALQEPRSRTLQSWPLKGESSWTWPALVLRFRAIRTPARSAVAAFGSPDSCKCNLAFRLDSDVGLNVKFGFCILDTERKQLTIGNDCDVQTRLAFPVCIRVRMLKPVTLNRMRAGESGLSDAICCGGLRVNGSIRGSDHNRCRDWNIFSVVKHHGWQTKRLGEESSDD